jgi:hypothetical protein
MTTKLDAIEKRRALVLKEASVGAPSVEKHGARRRRGEASRAEEDANVSTTQERYC